MFLFKMLILMNNLKLAQKYYVRSVPTVIIEKDGKEVQRFGGFKIGDGFIQMAPQRIKKLRKYLDIKNIFRIFV